MIKTCSPIKGVKKVSVLRWSWSAFWLWLLRNRLWIGIERLVGRLVSTALVEVRVRVELLRSLEKHEKLYAVLMMNKSGKG